jgi:hypothetical protein
MPTNRTPLRRPSRHSRFSDETLALFVELERTSQNSKGFEDGSRQLARLLDLVSERWTGQHVNDRSRGPSHPEGYIAREDWFRCRTVRLQLLAAVAGAKPAA